MLLNGTFFYIEKRDRKRVFCSFAVCTDTSSPIYFLFVLGTLQIFSYFCLTLWKEIFWYRIAEIVCNYLYDTGSQEIIFSMRYTKKRLLYLVSITSDLLISNSVMRLSLFIFQLQKKKKGQKRYEKSGSIVEKSIKCRKAKKFNTTSQRWSDRSLPYHGELQCQ